MEPLVRRIRPDDGPQARALRLEMLADTPIAYVETLENATQSPASRWDDAAARGSAGSQRATFVAEVDGRFVATATGEVFDVPTEVIGVYIAPAYRSAGLLARLIHEIAAWSLACGRDELFLEVAAENPRALAAYRRLGFVPTGGSAPHPLYEGVTEIEMSRPAAAEQVRMAP